jgi:transposase-like protein
MGILAGLKNRGVQDCLTAAAGGLAGFPDALNAVFPGTEARLCMARMVRNSVKYISCKDRKAVTAGLKETCLAPSADAASCALERFAEKWGGKYPPISKPWRSRRSEVIPFMKFPPETRKAVYTTNTIESVNYTLQRNLKTCQPFPNDEAAMKLIFMILKKKKKKWAMPVRNWGEALNQFSLIYGDRVPL